MHTPIKHALGILAIAASLTAVLPSTAAVDADDLGRAVGHHAIGGGALDDTFNACDSEDAGSTVTAAAYDQTGLTAVRAGDQGVFNSCVGIFGAAPYCSAPAGTYSTPTTPSPDCEYQGEAGMPYRIAANGLSGAGWSAKASDLELTACFYDAGGVQVQCNTGAYDSGLGDLVGTVPAGAAFMRVGSGLGSSEVSWWFGCDDFYYALAYGGSYCADPDA